MSVDLIVFIVILLFLMFIGLPTIRNTVTLPAELDMEEIPRSRLAKALAEHFQALDQELQLLGFTPLTTFRVTNLGSDNMLRLYLHAEGHTYALGTCLAANTPDGRIGQNYLEFIDEYTDGGSLTSRNADIDSLFVADPKKPVRGYPYESPSGLWNRHREESLKNGKETRIWKTREEIIEQGRESHREMCRYQVERGRLEFDPLTNRFRATYRLAFAGVLNFINPLADNFSVTRFLLTIVVAGAVPILGVHGLSELLSKQSLSEKEVVSLLFLGRILMHGLSGAVVGWAFPGKAFIWGFLTAYVPLLVFPAFQSEGSFLFSILSAFTANRVSSMVLSRRALLKTV